MTTTPVRVLLAIGVVVAFVGVVGLVSADTNVTDAGDRIGDVMPHDHGDHHDGEHDHGAHHNGNHHDGDHHHDEDHDHGEYHNGGSHC